jgi:hypothetical protein
MADCGGRFFDNLHGQFVKDGGFMADMAAPCGGFLAFHHGPPSITLPSAKSLRVEYFLIYGNT